MIDGKGTGVDYAYMHLRQRAAVQVGDRSTPARSSARSATPATPRGCHLHFEEWTAPGWYDGGRPFDPLPDLKRWDRTS